MTIHTIFAKNILSFFKINWIDVKFLVFLWKNNNITNYELLCFSFLKLLSNICYIYYSNFNIIKYNKSKYNDICILKESEFQSDISIIVPVYINNIKDILQLKKLIESIYINLPSLITIVNDGSPLNILEKIINLCQEYERINLISVYPNSGPAKARNIGLDFVSKRDINIVCLTDLDCLLSKDYIEEIININKNDVLLCGTTYSYGNTIFDKFHDLYGTLNCRIFFNYKVLYAPTCNLVFKGKNIIAKLRFDEDFSKAAFEDVEFCLRSRFHEKIDIIHIKNIKIIHIFNYENGFLLNIIYFCKKFIKYAKNEKLLVNKFKDYPYLYNQSFPISSKTNNILYIK